MCFASSIVEAHKKLFIAPNCASEAKAPQEAAPTSSAVAFKNIITSKMSRSKSRTQTEICGDCGASDPAWASINRGILLCSDCASVHRSLGRHISIVKSLRQANWEPSVLNFVILLSSHSANSVWEHHLLDGINASSSGKNATRLRKPTPKDALHPTKSDFIKAKHVNLAFVLKPSLQDDENLGGNLEQELSKQLHASVRTSNLETSLRLLVQGADPNFFHEEKRSTPLHVAAKFGQASQIELLLVYGADINALDGNGATPLEVAKVNNHKIIAERLLDAMYEVTDRIITFLGGNKPDHASGRHLVIPESNNAEISEQLKIARGRLQLVPNKMFEELVMDLYDEVDRRENEAAWSNSTVNADNVAVPFLPANPYLSATRNQGRQKLARFSRAEFAGLLTDVLIDARRRQNMANLRPMDAPNAPTGPFYNRNMTTSSLATNEHDPNLSDDEPIYDPVASDDDYGPPLAQQALRKPENQFEMETLRKQINDYVSEINQLKTVVQKLSSENSELKSKYTTGGSAQIQPMSSQSNPSVYDEPLRIDLNGSDLNENEPHSLPEGVMGGNGGVVGGTNTNSNANANANANANTVGNTSNSSSASSSANNSNQSTIKRPASMYERRLAPAIPKASNESRTTTSMYQMAGDKPFGEEVQHRTDLVTRRLKELIVNMHDPLHKDSLVPCAERIRIAVMELIAIFTTPSNCSEIIQETLKQLTRNNILIQHECENLQKAYEAEDSKAIENYVREVRDCAYYIASATKTLKSDGRHFHEEKRSTPLHVAAKFGQASQIELLLVYGADINALDGNGATPLEVAKSGRHLVISETNNAEISEQLKMARGRLQLVPNKMFEANSK